MAKEKEKESSNGDWMDDFFKEKGITEDEDKSFLKSRLLADEFVEAGRAQRKPKESKKSGRLFGGRASQD